MKALVLSISLSVSIIAGAPASAQQTGASIPADFSADAAERSAIEKLLATYTEAVSTKNQTMFESILLAKTIPFSYVPASAVPADTSNYEAFRRGVFEGAPFTQRFTDVQILVDGSLANVTLVFINTRAQRESWGWKTLHLLKTAQGWKIASEFFTSHS